VVNLLIEITLYFPYRLIPEGVRDYVISARWCSGGPAVCTEV